MYNNTYIRVALKKKKRVDSYNIVKLFHMVYK